MFRRRGLPLRLLVIPVLVGAGVAFAVLGRGGKSDAASAPPAASSQPAPSGAFSKAVPGPAASKTSSKLASNACPTPAGGKPVPDDFPKGVPIPPGTVITASRRYQARGFPKTLVIYGYAPMNLRAATLFFIRELPRRGYSIGRGDSEVGEAEAPFQGNGVRGAWKLAVGTVPCPNLIELLIGVSPLPKSS